MPTDWYMQMMKKVTLERHKHPDFQVVEGHLYKLKPRQSEFDPLSEWKQCVSATMKTNVL